jgi:Uma2 family endonuclease
LLETRTAFRPSSFAICQTLSVEVNVSTPLVVEIKSQSDRIKPLKEKIQMFLSLGAVVGILIDPDKEIVTVYRPTGEESVLSNEVILTVPELFPGWELPISQLWSPVFDEKE